MPDSAQTTIHTMTIGRPRPGRPGGGDGSDGRLAWWSWSPGSTKLPSGMNQPPIAQRGPSPPRTPSASAFMAWRNCQTMNTTPVTSTIRK